MCDVDTFKMTQKLSAIASNLHKMKYHLFNRKRHVY